MTRKQKILQLLTYYMDCYAHLEGSGLWDLETIRKFSIHKGMCFANLQIFNQYYINLFMPAPKINTGWWWKTADQSANNKDRQKAIKVRIDYMIKCLK